MRSTVKPGFTPLDEEDKVGSKSGQGRIFNSSNDTNQVNGEAKYDSGVGGKDENNLSSSSTGTGMAIDTIASWSKSLGTLPTPALPRASARRRPRAGLEIFQEGLLDLLLEVRGVVILLFSARGG